MQRKLKSLLIVASLFVALSIVFIACGAGDVIEITGDYKDAIDGSEIAMISNIDKILEGYEPPPSSAEERSSSSEDSWTPESSSSQNSNIQSSSSANNPNPGNSSSSQQSQPSSNSNTPSSSSTPPTSTTGCKENNPKSGFSCSWNITAPLLPGVNLKPGSYTLPAGCSVSWKYLDDNSPLAVDRGCKATDENGFTSEGSKTYNLFAVLTCEDGVHTNKCSPELSSKKAPTLDGSCEWVKNPTTTAKGGIPKTSNVTVVDTDGICKTAKSVVYKYAGGTKTVPATTGIIEAGVYEDVKAVLNCPDYTDSENVTVSCPKLTVNAGAEHSMGDETPKTQVPQITLDGVGQGECIEIALNWNNKDHLPDVLIECQPKPQYPNVENTITIDKNKVKCGEGKGSNYALASCTLGKVTNGVTNEWTVCVSSTTNGVTDPTFSCTFR